MLVDDKLGYRRCAGACNFTCTISALIGEVNFKWMVSALTKHFGEVIERAFTRDKLAPTDRTFFNIATRHMELTFKDSAIVARYIRGIPVALFFAVTNARNVSPLEFHKHDFLGGHDFLRPTFNHRHSAVQDSLWLSHEWSSILRQTAWICLIV